MSDFPAKLDDYGLDIVTITDTFEKALAIHERPYTNQVLSQDLGFRARRIRLDTAWYDGTSTRPTEQGTTPTYARHISFITHIKQGSLFTLQHPKYGVLKGNVNNIECHADDTQQYAAVKFEFVEEQVKVPVNNDAFFDVVASFNVAYVNSVVPMTSFIGASLVKSLGVEAGAITNIPDFDTSKTILEQLNNASQKLRNFTRKIDTAIARIQGAVSQVTNPVNSIIALTSYGVSAPGKLMSTIAQGIERIVVLNDTLTAAPAQFVEACKRGINEIKGSVEDLGVSFIDTMVYVQGACVVGQKVSTQLSADQTDRNMLIAKEATPSFSPAGTLVQTSGPIPVISVDDLERTLAAYKGIIQTALGSYTVGVDSLGNTIITLTGTDNRDLQFLLEMSRLMQDYISNVKVNYLTIKTVTVNDQPLHALLLANHMSYQAAERVLKLNPQIRCPNFVSGAIRIYDR
jgi:prophage DNA circulation protein